MPLRSLERYATACMTRERTRIRDGVPRQTFPFPLARVHSLPSEITAVALTAFSHVPFGRSRYALKQPQGRGTPRWNFEEQSGARRREKKRRRPA
ncbi:hypothetical protein PUN28_014332 [Cardiocondyla obscurior]|uniref:Uncharacterized protein n=1 Tax=Cardiocondyla obscurior TaxID=286306 RepID=A0AAW2F5G8_9HYME